MHHYISVAATICTAGSKTFYVLNKLWYNQAEKHIHYENILVFTLSIIPDFNFVKKIFVLKWLFKFYNISIIFLPYYQPLFTRHMAYCLGICLWDIDNRLPFMTLRALCIVKGWQKRKICPHILIQRKPLYKEFN